jgi:hypothetical protein
MGGFKDIATNQKLAALANAPDATAEAQVSTPAEIAAEEQFLTEAERRIRAHARRAVDAIVEIGLEFVAVKKRVGHGKYTTFVTQRLGWSMQSALNFSRVYELAKSTPDVDFGGLSIDARSLYLIAAPSTPAAVRQQVLERAAQPDGVSREDVERLVKEAREAERQEAQEKLQMQTGLLEGQIEELQNSMEMSAEVARGSIAAEYEGKLVLTETELFERVESAVAPTKARIEALEREREEFKESLDKSYAAIAEAGKKRPGGRFPDSTLSYRAMCVLQAIQALKDELKIAPPQCVQAERGVAAFHKQPADKLATARSNAIVIMSWLTEFLDVCDREEAGEPDPEPEPVETPIATVTAPPYPPEEMAEIERAVAVIYGNTAPPPRPDPRLEVPRAIAAEAHRKGVTVTALPGAVYEVRDVTGKVIAKADAMTVSDQIRALPDAAV